jgi:adenosylcobinamide amidohydrolase
MNKLNTLYFVQWREMDEEYSHQYETNDILKVLRKIGIDNKQNLLSLGSCEKSHVLVAVFEYITFFISTDMEKLIDCEKI